MKRYVLGGLLLATLLFTACNSQTTPLPDETVGATAVQTTGATDTRPTEIREVDQMLKEMTTFRYELADESYAFAGRWFEKEIDGVLHHVTVNAGSELYFAIHGTTEMKVNFTLITAKATPFYAVSIDGGEPVRYLVTEPKITLPDDGAHVIRIIADGLTESEDKFNGEIGFAFRDVDPCGGKLVGIRPTGKTIMFFGDSITEGVRALNMSADSNGNSASHSYPFYCAEKLGAVPINVGFAASGTVGAGSFAPCLTAIDRLSAHRTTDELPAPDVVVMAHGHNDVHFKASDVIPRYNAVLDRLHEKYPDAKLFVLIPYSQTHADTIRACCDGRDYVTIIETEGWDPATTDGVHLSAIGARSAGRKLADELKKHLGEDFFS